MATTNMWNSPPVYSQPDNQPPVYDPNNPYAREDWFRRNGYPDLERMPRVTDGQNASMPELYIPEYNGEKQVIPQPSMPVVQQPVQQTTQQPVSQWEPDPMLGVQQSGGANISSMSNWFGDGSTASSPNNFVPTYSNYVTPQENPNANLEQAKLDVDNYGGDVSDLNSYYAKRGRFGNVEHVQNLQGIKGSGTGYAYGDPTQASAYNKLTTDNKSTVDDYKKKFDYRYGFDRTKLPKTTPYAYSV